MKYWRGYLVAAIVTLCTWGLTEFAKAHVALIDMVYPYVDRIVMDYLAAWSADFAGCLWQTLLAFGIVLLVASGVCMFVFRWNPIQWFGWVLAVFYTVSLLNTGIYGLNKYAGSIAEDVRLVKNNYTLDTLERAAIYYRDNANTYAYKVARDSSGALQGSAFDTLNTQAATGFDTLVYEEGYAVFSGTTLPVKKLGQPERYKGITGKTVGLTGEAAVNPNVPSVGMPFAICHEMAHRMCVYSDSDADFSAFLACTANTSPEFIYSGYLMAFRNCYNSLAAIGSLDADNALARVVSGTSDQVMKDMEAYNSFLGETATDADAELSNLLVSWHIQKVAQYEDAEEQEKQFNPKDVTHENLKDLVTPAEE